MKTTIFDQIQDRIENVKCEPTRESILEIVNLLADLTREIKRVDMIACAAHNTASCLANGIQPD